MSHPLAKRKKSLVSMIPWIAENLNDHSNLEETLFTEIEGVIPDIRKKAEVFKPEHAAVKMAEAMQPYRNRLGIVLNQQYQTTANALKSIHEQIEKQKTPKKPESEIGQLMQFLKESEIRRQFEGVDKDTRRTILNQTAKAGDRTIIDALENSLAPLVSEPVLSSARAEYEKTAVDRNLVQSYEMNRRILDSLERTNAAAEKYLDEICEKNGIPTMADIQSNVARRNKEAMTSIDRSKFIGEFGLENFKKVISGQASLDEFQPETAQGV